MADISELIHSLHTPEELISTSNLAHNFEGLIILFIALTFLFEKRDFIRKKLRPAMLTSVGIFLIGFIFLHHSFEEWPIVIKILMEDRQQLQHFLLALVTIVGGITEFFGQRKKNILTLSIPAMLTLIGIIFLMHPQHGIEESVVKSVLFHEILGSIFIGAGFFLLAFKASKEKILFYLCILLLFLIALLLLTYQEPVGAYHYVETMT